MGVADLNAKSPDVVLVAHVASWRRIWGIWAHFLRDSAVGHGSHGKLPGSHPPLGTTTGAVQQRAVQHRGSALTDLSAGPHHALKKHQGNGGVPSRRLQGGSTQEYSLPTVAGG